MTDIIKRNWNSFKSKSEIWFFLLFLSTSTFSIRKVLFFFPINNSFNEYTGAYIYLSDIFLILTFLFYILCNNKYILSNIHSFISKYLNIIKLFHVEQSQKNSKMFNNNVPRGTLLLLKKTYTHVVNNYLIIFPLFIVFFSFLSILWTNNKSIATFRSIKLFEFVLLYFYIINVLTNNYTSKTTSIFKAYLYKIYKRITELFHVEQFSNKKNVSLIKISTEEVIKQNNLQKQTIVPRGTIFKNISLIIIFIGIIQSIVGIVQFSIQHSIGIFWLKESLISQNTPGVAKLILNNEPYIRAYGFFPHPNIFGGYLIFSIMLSLLYTKLFHVEQFNSIRHIHPEENNNKIIVPRGTIMLLIELAQIIALLLTFSKSAIIGLFIALFYIHIKVTAIIVPRGTITSRTASLLKMFHVEHFKRKLFLIASILVMLFVVLKPNINALFIKSLSERGFYINVSRGTFYSSPWIGIGAGQFVVNMANNYGPESWQLQPVHNVFLLILNEYGPFILIGFIYFIYKLFHVEQFQVKRNIFLIYSKGLLLAYIFIMFFDHYMWDIQQGQIFLWILFALIAAQKIIFLRKI